MNTNDSNNKKLNQVISFRADDAELIALDTSVQALGIKRAELALRAFRKGYKIAIEELMIERESSLKAMKENFTLPTTLTLLGTDGNIIGISTSAVSSVVEHVLDTDGVRGSKPLPRTILDSGTKGAKSDTREPLGVVCKARTLPAGIEAGGSSRGRSRPH